MPLVDYIRLVNAKTKFKIKDDFEFVEFDDITSEGITEVSPVPDQVEIWAAIKINYDGDIPDSYKVLNLMIGDWVEENVEELTKAIHSALAKHFEEHYPNSDTSDLTNDDGDSAIWLDQLDFMPRIDDDSNKSIIIEVELVMDTEAIGD